MSSNLTAEELQALRKLSEEYQRYKFLIGEAVCKLSELDDQMARIEAEKGEYIDVYKDLVEKDKEMNRVLAAKYGAGSINMETGEITP